MALNLVSWFGGKGLLLSRVLAYLDVPHKVYVEPYLGGGSVFLNKPKSEIEVINDVDKELVNLFRVMQDSVKYAELQHRLDFTLYSRDEFARALEIIQGDNEASDVMRAWAFFVGQNQGFSGNDCRKSNVGNWSRGFLRNQPERFRNKVERLHLIHERLRNAYIDCIDAMECIRYWDSPDTLFYLDPPYIHDTRIYTDAYQHEVNDDHHRKLVELLLSISGQAVLSGYHHEIYEPLLNAGWHKVEIDTVCHAIGKTRLIDFQDKSFREKSARTEVLYIWTRKHEDLFSG